jgi:hypothetical protein
VRAPPQIATNEFLELGVLGAMGLGLLAILGWVVAASVSLHGAPCTNPPSRIGQWDPLITVGACLGSFVLGRVAGLSRERRAEPAASHAATRRPRRSNGAILMQGALTLFLLLSAVLLAYETVSLAHLDAYWPITFYVRCANQIATFPTTAGACAICFLLGQWFWYPWRAR